MTTISRAYRAAFRTPLLISGTIIALFAGALVVTFRSSPFPVLFASFTKACTQAWTNFFTPPHIMHTLALSFFVIMVGLFVGSLAMQWLRTRRFLHTLVTSGSDGIHVVEHGATQCFCAGFLRPKIYVPRIVLKTLATPELNAVIAHERQHQSMHDPLKAAILRALSHAFFFLPLVRSYERRYHEVKEIAADAEALAIDGGKQSLASALMKLAPQSVPTNPVVSFFADRALIDLRIEFMHGHRYIPIPLTWSTIAVSASVVLVIFTLFIPVSRAETEALKPCEQRVTHPFSLPLPELKYRLSP